MKHFFVTLLTYIYRVGTDYFDSFFILHADIKNQNRQKQYENDYLCPLRVPSDLVKLYFHKQIIADKNLNFKKPFMLYC